MSFSIEFADDMQQYQARIKVVGCGGAGGNAINTMIQYGLQGVEFIAVNTDAQALNDNLAAIKIPIGQGVTKGLGAGADPEKGRKAALEDVNRLKEALAGADMVFVTAGMGGGTGTGAAPVVAQLAHEEGALTVGVVTKPFMFEGRQRARRAEAGLANLSDNVDTLITIPNQKLLSLGDLDLSFMDAFRKADEVLFQAVQGISDLITKAGVINVDFADVRRIMQDHRGRALMGTACAKGEGRARHAAQQAVASPLLDDISVDGATGVLLNIVGGPDMTMREIEEAASYVHEMAHEDADIIFGAAVDEDMTEMMKVTVIATGFDRAEQDQGELLRNVARQAIENATGSIAARGHAHSSQPRSTAYSIPSPSPRQHSSNSHHSSTSSSAPPASGQLSMQHMHGNSEPAPATVYSARAGNTSSNGVVVRESISFPKSSDADWDVPAYQRRGLG
ncbi:MAG: cell division protein FtsZ [Pseudomonadota bacterium]